MRFLATQAAKVNLHQTRTILTRLGQAFETKGTQLASSASAAERQRAFGMARDLRTASTELHTASADLLRLSAAARGMQPYQIKAEAAAAKERASAGWALSKLLAP